MWPMMPWPMMPKDIGILMGQLESHRGLLEEPC